MLRVLPSLVHRGSPQFHQHFYRSLRPRLFSTSSTTSSSTTTPGPPSTTRRIITTLLYYVWPKGQPKLRARVALALGLLVCGKLLNIQVPFIFKRLTDELERVRDEGGVVVVEKEGEKKKGGTTTTTTTSPGVLTRAALESPWTVVPLAILFSYGAARATSGLFTELRNTLFATVAQRAIRLVSRDVYRHLFQLDHRFHLDRQTGSLQRTLDRGSRSINFVLTSLVFNVVPTALEIGLVSAIFAHQCGLEYAGVTLATLASYVGFTVHVTTWRSAQRKELNRLEGEAASTALDGLLNYEAVKHFGGEGYEVAKYDAHLARVDAAAIDTQASLSALNFGQTAIFSAGLTAAMALASRDIASGAMTLGDLILVNGLLFQLSIPLNFVGMVYRELRQGLVDMEAMFSLLDQPTGVKERVGAGALVLPTHSTSPAAVAANAAAAASSSGSGGGGVHGHKPLGFPVLSQAAPPAIEFRGVNFSYGSTGSRKGPSQFTPTAALGSGSSSSSSSSSSSTSTSTSTSHLLLNNLSFSIPTGATVGIVGPSGCGKSTLVRLLYRFYDVAGKEGDGSGIFIHGQDIRGVTLQSLRAALCVVPQDTTLFHASVRDNIWYGARGGGSGSGSGGGGEVEVDVGAVEAAARAASLHTSIVGWKDGYETRVGERGLKLSGGEKQRVAVARAFLKNSPILLCDEATSALDTATEAGVMGSLRELSGSGGGVGGGGGSDLDRDLNRERKPKRTTLFIAHRLTTVMGCDTIIVLNKGRVEEQGTHGELLSKRGMYHSLWESRGQELR